MGQISCFTLVIIVVLNPYNDSSLSSLQGHSQVNFISTLLRVTMSDQLDLPVRQAGTLMVLGILF